MSNNLNMEKGCSTLVIVAALLGGCWQQSTPVAPPARRPSAVSSQREFPKPSQAAAEKPAAKAEKPPGAKPAESAKVDAFGLPLVIVIELPEVPKEIQGPSPPIPDEPTKPTGR
jgi:hypothetical protein